MGAWYSSHHKAYTLSQVREGFLAWGRILTGSIWVQTHDPQHGTQCLTPRTQSPLTPPDEDFLSTQWAVWNTWNKSLLLKAIIINKTAGVTSFLFWFPKCRLWNYYHSEKKERKEASCVNKIHFLMSSLRMNLPFLVELYVNLLVRL
jgi:hypothetical protein